MKNKDNKDCKCIMRPLLFFAYFISHLQVLQKLLSYSVLVLARVELIFFLVAGMGMCFGFVLNRTDNVDIIINIDYT